MKTKLAIVGYGKMGKLIEALAPNYNFEVVSIIDPSLNTHVSPETVQKAQIAIEFSTPGSAVENYQKLLECNIPIVTGTTGWYSRLNDVERMVSEHNGSFLYASNFSIGMNLMLKITEQLARLSSKFLDYRFTITEAHHIHKKDKPSGTAITLAEKVIANHPKYTAWNLGLSNENELHIESIREGEIIGIHTLTIDSEVDSITIQHSAKNREGFARGALLAAKFLINKKGFYTIDALLTF